MYNPRVLLVLGFVVALVLWLFVRQRNKMRTSPSVPDKTVWGKLGDEDVGDRAKDDGEMYDSPYYRTAGWTWWSKQHADYKPKTRSDGQCFDGTVNLGPPSFVDAVPATFTEKSFADKMPQFAYAPPVAWIETHN